MNEKQTAPEKIKEMDPEQLVTQYKRFLWKIVNRFKKVVANYGWIDESDLYQVASVALLKAQESYKPESEATFTTYAYRIITWRIYQALRIESTMAGTSYEPILLSLNESINKEGSITRGDTIPSETEPLEDMAERADTAARVRAAVSTLPKNQEEIINRLYLNDPTETRQKIAKDKGVSVSTIGQQKEKAFQKLRYKLRDFQSEMPHHITLTRFNTYWTSEPEQYVLNREKNFDQWLREYENFMENY